MDLKAARRVRSGPISGPYLAARRTPHEIRSETVARTPHPPKNDLFKSKVLILEQENIIVAMNPFIGRS